MTLVSTYHPLIGKKVPDFLINSSVSESSIRSLEGRWVILYFYPADDTEVCTRQACSFRDNLAVFQGLSTEVVGVSPDCSESHRRFATKYGLNFRLVDDVDLRLCKRFGVWQEKTLYGNTFMGVVRSTFVVDPRGIIRYFIPRTLVKTQIEKLSLVLKSLQNDQQWLAGKSPTAKEKSTVNVALKSKKSKIKSSDDPETH